MVGRVHQVVATADQCDAVGQEHIAAGNVRCQAGGEPRRDHPPRSVPLNDRLDGVGDCLRTLAWNEHDHMPPVESPVVDAKAARLGGDHAIEPIDQPGRLPRVGEHDPHVTRTPVRRVCRVRFAGVAGSAWAAGSVRFGGSLLGSGCHRCAELLFGLLPQPIREIVLPRHKSKRPRCPGEPQPGDAPPTHPVYATRRCRIQVRFSSS